MYNISKVSTYICEKYNVNLNLELFIVQYFTILTLFYAIIWNKIRRVFKNYICYYICKKNFISKIKNKEMKYKKVIEKKQLQNLLVKVFIYIIWNSNCFRTNKTSMNINYLNISEVFFFPHPSLTHFANRGSSPV